MLDPAFKLIEKQCREQNKDFPVRNHAFAIYVMKLNDAVENHESKNQAKIQEDIEKALRESLLSSKSIEGFIDAADDILSKTEDQILMSSRFHFSKKSFWHSVFSSMLGAFFYSLILLLLFIVAEDHIRPYAQRLFSDEDYVNQSTMVEE